MTQHSWIRAGLGLTCALAFGLGATGCSGGGGVPSAVTSTSPTTTIVPPAGTSSAGQSPAAASALRAIATAQSITSLPPDLTPPLQAFATPSGAKAASAVHSFAACDAYGSPAESANPTPCLLGDVQSTKTIVLVGDSNIGNWVPGLDLGLQQAGYRLAVFGFAGCDASDMTYAMYGALTPTLLAECNQWHGAIPPVIAALHPVAVIAASGAADLHGITEKMWIAGFTKLFADSTAGSPSTIRILMGTSPFPGTDPTCLAAHPNPQTCALHDQSGSGSFYSTFLARDPLIAKAAGATLIPTYPWFCHSGSCSPVVSNVLVFADKDHTTSAFSTFLAPVLTDAVLNVVTRG